MTSSGSKVDTEALYRFCERAQASASAVDRLIERLSKVHVGSLAFGQFPAGRQLHHAYDALVDDCKQGLNDTSGAFSDVSDGVRLSADQYDATEVANRDLFNPDGGR